MKYLLPIILLTVTYAGSAYGLEQSVVDFSSNNKQAEKLINKTNSVATKSDADIPPIQTLENQIKQLKSQLTTEEKKLQNLEKCNDNLSTYNPTTKKCVAPKGSAQKMLDALGCGPNQIIKNVNGKATCSTAASSAACSCAETTKTYTPYGAYSSPAVFVLPATTKCGQRYDVTLNAKFTMYKSYYMDSVANNIAGTYVPKPVTLKAICTPNTGWYFLDVTEVQPYP